jgi:hypothetical protein
MISSAVAQLIKVLSKSRKVVDSIPDVTGIFFIDVILLAAPMALGSTKTQRSTRIISLGVKTAGA